VALQLVWPVVESSVDCGAAHGSYAPTGIGLNVARPVASVVADEVRRLAESTGDSVHDIEISVASIVEGIEKSASLANDAGDEFVSILAYSKSNADRTPDQLVNAATLIQEVMDPGGAGWGPVRFIFEYGPEKVQAELEKSLGDYRIGSVHHLNAVPLTRGLEDQTVFLPPSQLAVKLRDGGLQ